VPVPLVALTAGTRITPDELTVKNLPREQVAADVLTNQTDLLGQALAVNVPAGQPISHSQLAEYSPQAGLSFVVPTGMRAVTVAVDNITGVSGFLKLGDRVDVLATFQAPQGAVTRTIMQNVEVLGLGTESMTPQPPPADKPAAVGGAAAPAASSSDQAAAQAAKPSATLAVTPEQAQVLVLSAEKGHLHLALRPKSDSRMVALPPATNAGVIGVPATASPPSSAGGESPNPASQTVSAMGAAGGHAGVALNAGAAGAAAPAAPPPPSVLVFKGAQREVVTPCRTTTDRQEKGATCTPHSPRATAARATAGPGLCFRRCWVWP
jgi:pilus assembly protein CpaB